MKRYFALTAAAAALCGCVSDGVATNPPPAPQPRILAAAPPPPPPVGAPALGGVPTPPWLMASAQPLDARGLQGEWRVKTEKGDSCAATLDGTTDAKGRRRLTTRGCPGMLMMANGWELRGYDVVISDSFKDLATLRMVGPGRMDGAGLSMWR